MKYVLAIAVIALFLMACRWALRPRPEFTCVCTGDTDDCTCGGAWGARRPSDPPVGPAPWRPR